MLIYQETTTLFCKIEAILNSQPLTAISSGSADISALMLGYFFTEGLLKQAPDSNMANIFLNKLQR